MPEIVVDSIDSVEESLRPAYVEVDGKFNLDVDKYAELKIQSSGLKKKNSDLIAKEKALRESLKKFEPLGDFDEDQLTEFQTWRENKDKQPPLDPKQPKASDELQAQFEKAQKRLTDKHAAELAERDKTIAAQDEKLKGYELTMPIRDAATKAGVFPEDLELVLKDVSGRIILNDDRKIVVLDDDGYPTDVTLEKYFAAPYRELRPKFYPPSGAAGSGAPSSTASTGGKRTMRRAEYDKLQMSDPQRASAFLKEVTEGKAALVDN